jgi:ABC-2 type transport system permease protein
MTHWRKIQTIATFEFLSAVKRRGYLITTFGMPLFVAAYTGIIGLSGYFMSRSAREPTVYGVVDQAGLLDLQGEIASGQSAISEEMKRALQAAGQSFAVEQAIARSRFVFRSYANEAAARADLAAKQLRGYFVVPVDYLADGNIDVYVPDNMSVAASESRNAFSGIMRERLLRGRLDENMSARVIDPLKKTRRFTVTRTGALSKDSQAAGIMRFVVPLGFTVLFLMSVLMTSGYLMQGTAVEKENKVVEVLLASANPDEILTGKLLGLGGAGLLQIAVWLVLVLGGGIGVLPLLLATEVSVPWVAVALALPLFIVAFLFFGSLMLGSGSLGANMREAQQLAMVWSLTAALPMMLLPALIRDPHGTVARVLTWLPFSSGQLIMFRASTDLDFLAWWEIAGAFAVLLLSTWAALRIGAKLFRIGLLSSSRPKLREVLRQARLAD